MEVALLLPFYRCQNVLFQVQGLEKIPRYSKKDLDYFLNGDLWQGTLRL